MLTEIYCGKFQDSGASRQPIKLHKGLNVVLGSASATNSIGKTTFLLAIDFAFGGKTYIETGEDIEQNIGPHAICFTFEFAGTPYRFARHTDNPDEVFVCNAEYHAVETWSIAQFTSWLQEQYGMAGLGGSFRELAGSFFRIYGKDNYDETKPLRSFAQDTAEKGVDRLLKLFGEYKAIERLKVAYGEALEKKRAFTRARKHAFVKPADSAREVKRNELEIGELKAQRAELMKQSEEGLADIDPVTADHAAKLKRDISSLRRSRGRLATQLATMRDDLGIEQYKGASDYSKLQEFFPNVAVRRLEEIEEFHKRLNKVLKSEHEDAKRDLKDRMEALDIQIKNLENELSSVKMTPNVSVAVLESYADLSHRIRVLEDANECFEQQQALASTVKMRSEALRAETESILRSLETVINDELERLNRMVCSPKKTAPQISIPDSKHYRFEIPNDTGTGSQTRGMFLFDYVLLEQSYLPAFAHDTNTIKQVQDDVMVKLLELYAVSDKQVFVAVDKAESFADGALPVVVELNTILKLGPGHELFGRSWNEKTSNNEQSKQAQRK